MYYEQLKAGVIQHDLLVDNLIYKVSLFARHWRLFRADFGLSSPTLDTKILLYMCINEQNFSLSYFAQFA